MATKTSNHDQHAAYLGEQYGSLIGRTIKAIRPMYAEEVEDFDWGQSMYDVPFIIILDDDTVVIPSQDPEGNGPGHLFVERLEG